ncbi:hypothetical protein [Novosphingobium sp. FKTRR1]|uniref:hypothetical protein n=1 Tax=unclassified Novosphingobium TaxID=2644732 RepID=UPI001CF076A9|nr:hypothetical protein [Novosphingobium sp. FKTRR1]
MSPVELLALAFIVVGLPVTLGIGGDVYKRRLAFKERQLDMLSRQNAAQAAQAAAHTERLEQRLRVLERIVTDRSMGLAAQIEDLREPVAEHRAEDLKVN